MAEKLATRLEKVQGEIHEMTGIFRRAQGVSEDDLMDGEYYVDQLNKAVRRLNALSKKYEDCAPPPEVAQVNNTATKEDNVPLSGQKRKASPPPDSEDEFSLVRKEKGLEDLPCTEKSTQDMHQIWSSAVNINSAANERLKENASQNENSATVNTTTTAEHSGGKNLNSVKQDSDTDEGDLPLSVRKARMEANDVDDIPLSTLKSNPAVSDKSKEDEDVRISGQSGGSVDSYNVYNLCFIITNACDIMSFMKI